MEQIIADNTTDTICALSTPAGRGGIAVVRVSGPGAIDITDSIWNGKSLQQAQSHTTHLGTVLDTELRPLDQALATIFRSPNSFTGENVVEISVHGSIYIQQQLLASLIKAGARMAEPGEFTRRAYLNSRLDLAEAEAVADIIASSSRAAHSLAMSQLQGRFSSNINALRDKLVNIASLLELELDFSEEDVTFADRSQLRNLALEIKSTVDSLAATFDSGQAIVNGIPVAIVGRPNVGKSRLLNTLLQTDRAIVSDIPGTTRDTVEDTMDIHGTTFRFIDTAGIRHTDDPIEKLGIDRAKDKISQAKIIIWLISPDELADQSAVEEFQDQIRTDMSADSTIILAINKIDTIDISEIPATTAVAQQLIGAGHICNISALKNTGIDNLKNKILELATTNLPDDESMIVTNARHHAALQQASKALTTMLEGLPEAPPTPQPTGVPGNTPACALPLTPDLLAYHLREAINSLSTITGTITSQEILNTIFSRFCIGK